MHYVFGDCDLDTHRRELRRGGQVVGIPSRSLDVLLYLIETRDHAISRQALLDKFWPDVHITDNALTRTIERLRTYIGDDRNQPHSIETLRNYGYRFIAAVTLHEDHVTPAPPAPTPPPLQTTKQVALLYKRHAQPDEHVLQWLETQLTANGYTVFIDRHLTIGVEWAQEIVRQLQHAEAVIPLLSAASVHSEMLAYELQKAHEASQMQQGKPRLLPVRINFTGSLPEELASILDQIEYFLWTRPNDHQTLMQALHHPAIYVSPPLEPPGGALPLTSPFYVVRNTDQAFHTALQHREFLVLVKGARQMGKTSLVVRKLQEAK
jgi:DNA-binding winged helix-turn-helix (wHTH) protein